MSVFFTFVHELHFNDIIHSLKKHKMNCTTHKLLLIIIIAFSSLSLFAQSKKEMDIKAIKSMAGCYDVTFKYTETFAPEVDYEQAYDYTSAAFEWAEIIEESDNKIVLQHLLIIQQDTLDPYIIKHWRQDWVYESDKQFKYDKDNRWIFQNLDKNQSKGKWTQSVFQVDDSPRYSGTATWTHVDGISSWFQKSDSPLPRREYSKRDDYNVMKRGNRIQITSYGWLHEQDNDKVIRNDSIDVLLVQEKGYNTYKRRQESDCEAAQAWWEQNKLMWSEVREVWDDVYSNRKDIKLAVKLNEKRLYEHLFFSEKEWNKERIQSLIKSYEINDPASSGINLKENKTN